MRAGGALRTMQTHHAGDSVRKEREREWATGVTPAVRSASDGGFVVLLHKAFTESVRYVRERECGCVGG